MTDETGKPFYTIIIILINKHLENSQNVLTNYLMTQMKSEIRTSDEGQKDVFQLRHPATLTENVAGESYNDCNMKVFIYEKFWYTFNSFLSDSAEKTIERGWHQTLNKTEQVKMMNKFSQSEA